MGLQEDFDKAAADVKNLKAKPTDQELLDLYALFKQATVGDNGTARPGMLDFKGKAKWDAWAAKKGLDSTAAKQQYIVLANNLIAIYGVN